MTSQFGHKNGAKIETRDESISRLHAGQATDASVMAHSPAHHTPYWISILIIAVDSVSDIGNIRRKRKHTSDSQSVVCLRGGSALGKRNIRGAFGLNGI